MSGSEEPPRRSLAEEAVQLVDAVRVWSATPEVRSQLATAATSLLSAAASLLDEVAAHRREQRAGEDRSGGAGRDAAADPPH